MDKPIETRRDDSGPDPLWSEAIWGLGLIGTVVAIVAVIAAFGA
jgi:hypothetical protein